MSSLRIQRPRYVDFIHLKECGFSITKYTIRNLEGFQSNLNWFEIKEELEKLEPEYYLPSLKELTRAFETLLSFYPNYQKIAVEMLRTQERTDDIICWPDKNWFYARNIKPPIQRGKHPVLIQKAGIEKIGNKDIIKDGKRIEIPDFPKTSGKLRYDIEELGLSEGTYVFSNSEYKKYQGLRNLIRSNMSVNPKKRYVIATFSPWTKSENIGFRFCSTRTSEPILEDFLKNFEKTQHVIA